MLKNAKIRSLCFPSWSVKGTLNYKTYLDLKELYTSETTLAKKIVLTPLNNEFTIKIQNSTSFMLKNPQIFLQNPPQKR